MNYLGANRRNLIAEWFSSLSPRVQAKFDERMGKMAGLRKEEWPTKWATSLSGFKGIFEMRLDIENVQYRPLFCFGPLRGQITILIGAIEKGNKFTPTQAPYFAVKRRAEIIKNNSRVIEHGLLD